MTRAAILDAAEAILSEEGYAAVSSRKVANVAGLKSKLVHYYFRTMDELFLALLHRVEERHFQHLCVAVASKNPLGALWAISIDQTVPRLHKEFLALATHRDELRQHIARSAERTRSIYSAVLARALEDQGIDTQLYPPVAMAILMDGVARVINTDKMLGASAGHAEALGLVSRLLAQMSTVEPASPPDQ